jgi:hypothetical protein
VKRLVGPALALLVVVTTPGLVAAQPAVAASDRVGAEALFNEGRTLLAAGKYGEACAKFAASHRLEPAVGTLLNLGDCEERRGALATAWAHFREAVSLAATRNDERARIALASAAALEPRLGHLRVRVPAGASLRRDAEAIDPALFGMEVPIDAGAHLLEASAPGKRIWKATVETENGLTTDVAVPALEDDAPPARPTPVRPPETGGPQRTLGLVTAGFGVVGLGLGAAFGLGARARWSTVTEACPDRTCPTASARDAVQSAHDEAGRSATLSTVGFVAGGALLAAGAALFFTAPRAPRAGSGTRVAPMVGGLGAFVGGDLP